MISKDLDDNAIKTLSVILHDLQGDVARDDKATVKACGALLIEVLLVTGMRGDELCRVKVKDLDFSESLIHIFNPAKNSKAGSCSIPQALMRKLELATVRRGLGMNDYLVAIFTRNGVLRSRIDAIRRYWVRLRIRVIGNKSFRPSLHCFRHTMARVVYEDTNYNIRATQAALRHKAINSTEAYIAKFDEKKLRAVIQTSRLVKQ